MGQRRLAEQGFARGDIGFGECFPCRGDFDVALVGFGESQQRGGFHDGQQIVHFHLQLVGNVIQIFFAAAIVQKLEQSRDAARAGVRQHLERLLRGAAGSGGSAAASSSGCVISL